MALVDYASSDEDEDHTLLKVDIQPLNPSTNRSIKRKRDDESSTELPPLPSKFHDLYASTTRVSTRDDPSLHGGRKRVTPHVEGNWPTHIYIEWYPTTAEYEPLSQLITALKKSVPSESTTIHSFLTSDLGAQSPLHVSLSRPIGFATEQKGGFLASLEQALKSSGIRPFDFHFSNLDWVPNFEKTRWFLVLRIESPTGDGMNKLLHVSNKVVQEHGQPPLYAQENTPQKASHGNGAKKIRRASDAKMDWTGMQDLSKAFHISIAWTLEPPDEELVEATKFIATQQLKETKSIAIKVEEIKAKIGNVVTNIRLHKNIVEGKSLFGF